MLGHLRQHGGLPCTKSTLSDFRMKNVASVSRLSRSSREHRRSFAVRTSSARRMPRGQDGRRARSPRRATVGCRRSRRSANGSAPQGVTSHCPGRHARTPPPSPARQRGGSPGACQAVGHAPGGVWTLDAPTAGSCSGGLGIGGIHQS